jgi:cardiolipin synthase
MTPIRRLPTWWTVPNLVTVIRIVLIVPIVALVLTQAHPLGAAALAALFGASDWIDGYLARRFDQVSRVGEVLDPIADRVGVGCIAIALAVVGAAPWWVIAVFPAVDLIVVGVYLTRGRRAELEVTWLGKVRTAVAMAGFLVVMVGLAPDSGLLLPVGQAALAVGAVLHVGAGALYARQMLARSPVASSTVAATRKGDEEGGRRWGRAGPRRRRRRKGWARR